MTDLLRHHWGKRISVSNPTTGCEQGEYTCTRCDLVRITVHPPQGFPWREWRTKDGTQMQLSSTPPCIARGSPLSGEDDSVVSAAPDVSRVNPHHARNPQGHMAATIQRNPVE